MLPCNRVLTFSFLLVIKTCPHCGNQFEITQRNLKFYEAISPTFDGKTHTVPPPKLCPDCRLQRRLLFRNDRHFYHRKSACSGKPIISIYSPDKEHNVYDQDEWWSDRWDARDYARDIDFSRPLSEQLKELRLHVPCASLYTTNIENSYYTNHSLNMKNCYLIYGGGNNEDCLYGGFVSFSEDVVDGLSLYSCKHCYEGIASQNCYQCLYFKNCRDCSDCLMIEDCSSCRNCIACFGLHKKEYCLLNEELGKEEYEKRKEELGDLTLEKVSLLGEKLEALAAALPHRATHIYASENCTGDMIFNSKNCINCFDITDSEDSANIAFMPKGMSSSDCTFAAPDGVEKCYELCSSIGTHSMFSFLAWHCNDTSYSLECHNCHDLFGCVGMRNSHHCILNKEYPKEEYEKLVSKLIAHMRETGEWGEFLNPALSAFGYNESMAADYYPLTKDQALVRGWQWSDAKEKRGAYLGPKASIEGSVTKVNDAICDKILTCVVSGKPYKIVPQELHFYRKMGIPIPALCPDQRHTERIQRRNPRKLWKRTCGKCGGEVRTTYAPDRPETIYCERCYLETVY